MPRLLPFGRGRKGRRARLVGPCARCLRTSIAWNPLCLSTCWIYILKSELFVYFLAVFLGGKNSSGETFPSLCQAFTHIIPSSSNVFCARILLCQNSTPPSVPNLYVTSSVPNLYVTSLAIKPLVSPARINPSLVSCSILYFLDSTYPVYFIDLKVYMSVCESLSH